MCHSNSYHNETFHNHLRNGWRRFWIRSLTFYSVKQRVLSPAGISMTLLCVKMWENAIQIYRVNTSLYFLSYALCHSTPTNSSSWPIKACAPTQHTSIIQLILSDIVSIFTIWNGASFRIKMAFSSQRWCIWRKVWIFMSVSSLVGQTEDSFGWAVRRSSCIIHVRPKATVTHIH